MEVTQDMRQKAIDYKKNIAGKFMLVEGAKIKARISGEQFCVTRKIDGHLQCLFYRDGAAVMLNSQGKERAGELKCLDVFAGFMGKKGIKSAIIAAELYVPREGGRPRCGDVQSALADAAKRDTLALAPFDIIELDGQPFVVVHYDEVYAKLTELFSIVSVTENDGRKLKMTKSSSYCRPVEMRTATSIDEVQQIYEEWVEGEGAEGIVVHNENRLISKVKPRHSIDAVVVGYSTTERGIRDVLLAVRHEDGAYQMFGHGSTGMTDEQRAELAERLSAKHVESQYILSDSRGIAYQMVAPEVVLEMSVLELVARGNDDKVKTNPLLAYDEAKGWIMQGMVPGVSTQGITFDRERTDKQPTVTDVRLSQLTDICPFEEQEGATGELQPSTLLERRVFKKVSGAKVMLHKFLIWKTNKEATGRYPAYIFYHTDYSSARKEMIKRDMAFSSDEQQIRDILAAELADNIKKGWEEVLCNT